MSGPRAHAFPPPAVAEQLVVGVLAGVLAGIADVVAAAVRRLGGGVDPGDFALAGLHLVAMQLPPGLLVGAAVGGVLGVLRAAPWAQPLRARLSSPGRWLHHDPEGFATGVGLLAAAGGFVLVARQAALHFATRYHDPGLAAWAMAGAALALVLAATVAVALVAAVLRPLARRMGRLACPATLALLALAALGAVVATVAVRAPQIFRVYDPVMVAWAPGAVVLYLLVALAVRRVLRRRGIGARRVRLAAAGAATLTVVALTASGALYGARNHVRSVVEHRAITGLGLLRFYQNATDRDGDGHSFAFGGDDCDDTDPNVHPGVLDEEGDGIDADCFAGDGTPEVADLGDGRYGEPPPGLDRPNILLLSVDALRPDHLGCYGYERDTSPRIDALAKESVRFETVIAQSSRSIRSVPSMRTGFYPSQIAYGPEYLWPTLEPENETFSEVLAADGYATAVTMGTDYFERIAHFFQGYQRVNQIDVYRPARPRPVTEGLRQLDRLQKRGKPWLLWIHLFNVHEEYLWDDRPSKFGDRPIDAYDTEITFADRQIGRVLDALEKRGLEEDTIVVFTSDHGEAFGEHGNRGHSFTLYEEELRVPLLLRIPGVEPRVVEQPVALFDLAPTLLNLVQLPVPEPMPARSLVPLVTGEGRHPDDRLIFSEILPDGLYPYDQKAIRRGPMKLIWWVREGTFQLYDLEADPGEHDDLSDERRGDAEELLGLLRAWVAETNLPEHQQQKVVDNNRLEQPPRRMDHRLDLRFPGLFEVLGFDMPKKTFQPGERIDMTFYYRVTGETDRNLFFYVDIEGPKGYRVPPHFHAHHYPLNGRYPTHDWKEGEILRDPVEMVIPKDIRHPVELDITLRILHRRQPQPFASGERKIHLATVDVK